MDQEKLESIMTLAIDESEKSTPEDQARVRPKVGAVVVDEHLNVIEKSYRNEDGSGGHAEYILIDKLSKLNITDFRSYSIFATLEPCTHRGHGKKPCAQRIVEAGFGAVYVGALDPNPEICGHGETYLRDRVEKFERFPSDLDRRIRIINKEFWDTFVLSHLPTTSMYVKTRIPDLLKQYLKERNVNIAGLIFDSDSNINEIENIILNSRKVSISPAEIHKMLRMGISEAFDKKYSEYSYDNDARKIGKRWQKEIKGVLSKRFGINDYTNRSIIDVGFGNGEEGVGLFEDCRNFTAVDIAPQSLRIAQRKFPTHTFIVSSADELGEVKDGSKDIYLSLRTYQSAFFDIDAAIEEAYRVLKPGGTIIISVANAYIEGSAFIRGLLPHGSTVINRNEAHRHVSEIRKILLALQFQDIGVHSGNAEEYIFASKPVY